MEGDTTQLFDGFIMPFLYQSNILFSKYTNSELELFNLVWYKERVVGKFLIWYLTGLYITVAIW